MDFLNFVYTSKKFVRYFYQDNTVRNKIRNKWQIEHKLDHIFFLYRFFLFRISSQILRFSQKLRFSHFLFGLIFKRISSQKKASLARTVPKPSMRQSCTYCAEAFKLCPSHPCASLARTVLKPLSFLAGTLQPLAILRYRPPTLLVVK